MKRLISMLAVQVLVPAPRSSAVRDCPALAGHAKARGVEISRGQPGTVILPMSTPVTRGDEALVEVGELCGDLCGQGDILRLARGKDGHWAAVETQPTWIS